MLKLSNRKQQSCDNETDVKTLTNYHDKKNKSNVKFSSDLVLGQRKYLTGNGLSVIFKIMLLVNSNIMFKLQLKL